jgi:hypothetical protein
VEDLVRLFDEDEDNVPPEYQHWKAAYKWSRKARLEFNYPTFCPANKIIVSDWLRKAMLAEHVRPGQMVALHPMAVSLTFVRSRAERDAAEALSMFESVSGFVERATK